MNRVMKQNRRKFFGLVGTGVLGAIVSQIVPLRLIAGKDADSARRSKPKVVIHPLAVPRINRSAK
jgi:hypothetical protein